MELIAHRGLSRQYPENTLPAFLAAVEAYQKGVVQWLEFDLCLTRDGHFVVIHDDTLNRTTTGVGFVAHHSVAELQLLDAGSWFRAKSKIQHNGQVKLDSAPKQSIGVLTIEELLEAIGGKIPLNIEIKPFFPIEHAQLWQSALWRLLKRLDQHNWTDSSLISSSNMFMLEYVRQMHDTVKLGMIYQPPVTDYDPLYVAERLQAYSLHPHYRAAKPELVSTMHAHGLKVFAYTINTAKRLQKMQLAGVDGVFTDVPEKLMASLSTAS